MDTENSKFHQGFTLEVHEVESFEFRKCPRDLFRAFLTLQEVGVSSYSGYF